MGLGCGCCGLVLLMIGSVVGAGFFGVSAVKDYVEDMKDPESRAAKARELLGASQLPEGYFAQFYVRIPWVFDLVVLSDGEPAVMKDDSMELQDENFGERAFIFFTIRQGKMDENDVDDMLQGRRTNDGVEVDVGLEVAADEELASGAFDVGPQRLKYKSHRGEVSLDGKPVPGIYSRILFDCEGDTLTRAAVWFQRAPEAESAEALAIPGSPADEAALRQFLGHFNVCVD
ncbi:MAG: hypothetical protein AAF560_07210 [Acidobacteriota bacterium]